MGTPAGMDSTRATARVVVPSQRATVPVTRSAGPRTTQRKRANFIPTRGQHAPLYVAHCSEVEKILSTLSSHRTGGARAGQAISNPGCSLLKLGSTFSTIIR